MTCLHLCCLQATSPQLLKLLLERDSDPTIISKEGNALDIAVRTHNKIVEKEIRNFLSQRKIPMNNINNNNNNDIIPFHSIRSSTLSNSNLFDFNQLDIANSLKKGGSTYDLSAPVFLEKKRGRSTSVNNSQESPEITRKTQLKTNSMESLRRTKGLFFN